MSEQDSYLRVCNPGLANLISRAKNRKENASNVQNAATPDVSHTINVSSRKDKVYMSSTYSPNTDHPKRGGEQDASACSPVTLSESSLIVLALVRLFVGLLWFQQLFWKLPPSFAGLYSYVVREGKYTFLPGYSSIIQHVFLPNFLVLGAFTWTAELLVALSLLFGLFSRFGALLSALLALQLYIGLAYAPGEWYWTYGMLVLLGVALSALPSGRRLGLDQWIAARLASMRTESRAIRGARWFV
jgi:thiosulfate dehydrogenase [quinone] large subunit